MGDKKSTSAPPPISPVHGFSLKPTHRNEVHKVHLSSPVDWSNWTEKMRVTHEQAVALSMNLEPGPENEHRRPDSAKRAEEFQTRLKATGRRFSKTNIGLAEFALFACGEAKWQNCPAELASMNATLPGNCAPSSEKESVAQRRARFLAWHREEERINPVGAVQRVYERERKQNPKADRSNIGKDIQRAKQAEEAIKQQSHWERQLIKDGKRKG